MHTAPTSPDTYRPLGLMAAKILQGTRPGEIPVEQPRKLELVVNLSTARAIDVIIPASILRRVNEIIE